MTTHLRARAAQAVGLLALVVGGIAVAPGVALAAQPSVSVTQTSPTSVLSGGKVTVSYKVTGGNGGLGGGDPNGDSIAVKFNLPSGVQCGDCGQQVTLKAGESQTFSAHLTMPQVGAGQSQTVAVSIVATSGNDQSAPAQTQITVQGPDKPQSVRAITGKVKDTSGKGVSGARVGAQDSTGKTFQSTTTGNGSFSILATDANPIAPGNIQVGAGKDGYGDGAVVSVTGEAGKTVTVNLTLKPLQASASASASASPTASSASLDPGSILDTNAPAGPSAKSLTTDATKKTGNDSGSSSMLFVILGGLLVAAGVGAIVLVVMRRRNSTKNDGGGPGGGDPTAMGGGPSVVPPSQGRFNDATRVGGAPVGAMGGPAAATMVAPRSGAPSMADAPTMLQRPVPAVAAEDEFPDPYGAPLPQQGGYVGAAAGGWDDQGAGQYAAPTQYGQADDDYAGAGAGQYGGGQYGGAAGGQERFDEHTSLYRPEAEQDGYGDYDQGGYGGAGGGQYGAGAYAGGAAGGEYGGGQYGGGAYGGGQDDGYQGGGYGQEPAEQGGYGSWGAPAGGIDSGNAYGPQGGPGAVGPAAGGPGGGQPGGAHGAGGTGGTGGTGGQYGGGTYGGAANGGGTYGAGAANGTGTYGGGQYGAGYDDRGGYEQGYDQPAGGQFGGNDYGRGNGQPPQPGGDYGYDQYDEDNNGYGGRRGYEDDQQPTRRGGGGGGGRRPGGY